MLRGKMKLEREQEVFGRMPKQCSRIIPTTITATKPSRSSWLLGRSLGRLADGHPVQLVNFVAGLERETYFECGYTRGPSALVRRIVGTHPHLRS